jgi:hypothetical protein
MSYTGRPVTDSIVTLLAGAGLLVGEGDKPAGAGWQGTPGQSTFRAYVVVHPIGAASIDGTLDTPSDDVFALHQLSAFGATQDSCQQVADRARAVMLGAGWQLEFLGGVVRTDDVQPPLFMSPDRYSAFRTT